MAPSSVVASQTPEATSVAAQLTLFRSNLGRDSATTGTQDQIDTVVSADESFALRLYRQLAAADSDNLFVSPYSISTSLSMVLAGARGNTAAELASALGVADAGTWDAERNVLDQRIGTQTGIQPSEQSQAQPLVFESANSMFGQAGYPFEQPYLDVLARDYGSGVQAADFATQPEAARLAINDWVANQTEQRIKDLLAKGTIDDMTLAVLVNALYFKANWMKPFDPVATNDAPFQLLDGGPVSVPTLHSDTTMSYADGPNWSAVQLAYFGASMMVIVPDSGTLTQLENNLTPDFISRVDHALTSYEVTLSLPKWSTESSSDLVEPLQALGVHDLFDVTRSDLSGITQADQLVISHVEHKANIDVDEHGTEAAAATASVAELLSRPQPATLTVDRPFIYLIRDFATNEILFMGRVTDPS